MVKRTCYTMRIATSTTSMKITTPADRLITSCSCTYKLRKDIRCDDITKAPSLLKMNFDIYLNLQYRIQRERIRSDDFRELRQDYGLFFDKCQRLEQESMSQKKILKYFKRSNFIPFFHFCCGSIFISECLHF